MAAALLGTYHVHTIAPIFTCTHCGCKGQGAPQRVEVHEQGQPVFVDMHPQYMPIGWWTWGNGKPTCAECGAARLTFDDLRSIAIDCGGWDRLPLLYLARLKALDEEGTPTT